MRIRTKLIITATSIAGFAGIMGFLFWLMAHRVDEALRNVETADRVITAVSELSFISRDLPSRNVRAQTQWNLRYSSLGEILDEIRPSNEEEKRIVRNLSQSYDGLNIGFARLVSFYERGQNPSGKNLASLEDSIQRTESSMSANLLRMIEQSNMIIRYSHSSIRSLQYSIAVLILIFILGFMTLITAAFLFLYRGLSASLGELEKGARLVAQGNLDHSVNVKSGDEMGEVALAFNQMRSDLKRAFEERKKAEEKIRESERRLKVLSSQLLLAQEQERKRVAQDLHDGLAADLAAVKFSLERKAAMSGGGSPSWKMGPEEIISTIQRLIDDVRNIMNDLHPSVLDDLGIVPTITWYCRKFQALYSDLIVEQKIALREEEIPRILHIAIYRVLQEAMNNAAKHGKAKRVGVSLTGEDGGITLVIADDGQGFDPEEKDPQTGPKGLGLGSMKERVELSGGVFNLSSRLGTGTRIEARWPKTVASGV